jgi:hypothetical protein
MKSLYLFLAFVVTLTLSLNEAYAVTIVNFEKDNNFSIDEGTTGPCDLPSLNVTSVSTTNSFNLFIYTVYFTVDGISYWATYNPLAGTTTSNYPGNVQGGGGSTNPYIIIDAVNDCGPITDTLIINTHCDSSGNNGNGNNGNGNGNGGGTGTGNNGGGNGNGNNGNGNGNGGGNGTGNSGGGNGNGNNGNGNGNGGGNGTGNNGGGNGNGNNGNGNGNGGGNGTSVIDTTTTPCDLPQINVNTVSTSSDFNNGNTYTVYFTVDSSQYYSSYNSVSGNITSNYPTVTGYTSNTNGSYVIITATNNCGTVVDTVFLSPSISNGGQMGVMPVNPQNIYVYPNPTVATIFVNFDPTPFEEEVVFIITDMNGMPVHHVTLIKANQDVNVGDLKRGIHSYRIIVGDKIVKSSRILLK